MTPDENTSEEFLKQKILFILGIYPRLSHSMLQIGMGTGLPALLWRPSLDALIAQGVVKSENVQLTTPSGRAQTYKVLSLADSPEAASVS